MSDLARYLRDNADNGLLPWQTQVSAADQYGMTCGLVEEAALALGILPSRYQRNRRAFSVAQQLILFRSRVTVIGCGGLGGYVIEQLARLGIGHIVAVDPDVFEEHNLNRQILSTLRNLGHAKVEAASIRVAEINPSVTLIPIKDAFSPANGRQVLEGSTVVVDALDSIQVRLELAKLCTELSVPLVHGAIGGWFGHVATQFPGDGSIETMYQGWVGGKGIETELGNPAFTPAVVASLEVAEVCKILLGEGEPLQRRKLSIDLLAMEFHEIGLDNNREYDENR